MKDLKRNLIYWGRTYEWLSLSLIVGIGCYLVVMSIMGGGFSQEEFKSSILGYIWLFLIIGGFVNVFSGLYSYYPLTISLGSTRKGSYAAMQIVQHLIMVQYLLIGAVAYYFLERELFFVLVKAGWTIIGLILILLAYANVVCICSVKFSKTVGMVMYVGSLVLIVMAIVVLIVSETITADMAKEGLNILVRTPYLFLVGLILDALSIAAYYYLVKKSDLQF